MSNSLLNVIALILLVCYICSFKMHSDISLRQIQHGASITDQIQSYIRALIQNGYNKYGLDFKSNAVYLTTSLNRAYQGSWAVIIQPLSFLNPNNVGYALNSENDQWWTVWRGQFQNTKNWTFYFSKLKENNYQYILVRPEIPNGDGLNKTQSDSLYNVARGKIGSINYTQSANQISIISEAIVPECTWNVFMISPSVIYGGYVPIISNRYISGTMTYYEGKQLKCAFDYLLTCV